MKMTHLLPALFATACFAASDSNTKPALTDPLAAELTEGDEKTAVANFKDAIEATTKWMEEKQKTANDPMAGIAMMGEMVTKFKGIKTDGLPTDLKAAWGDMVGVVEELGGIFKGMPKLDATKPEEMQKVMGDLMPKMIAVMTKADSIAKKLEEVGKKYGLSLGKLGPGGGK